MQTVLITGGAGFIGQNLVHAWRAARPTDRLFIVDAMTYAANIRSLEPLIADRSIQFVKGDIRDAALMHDLFEAQRIRSIVFDIELIYLARRRGYSIAIVPIRWSDRRGSRMRPRLGHAHNRSRK